MEDSHPIIQAFFACIQHAIKMGGLSRPTALLQLHRSHYGGPDDERTCRRDMGAAHAAQMAGHPLFNDADRALRLHSWPESVRLMALSAENKRPARLPPYQFEVSFEGNVLHCPNHLLEAPNAGALIGRDYLEALRVSGWYGRPHRHPRGWYTYPGPELQAAYQQHAQQFQEAPVYNGTPNYTVVPPLRLYDLVFSSNHPPEEFWAGLTTEMRNYLEAQRRGSEPFSELTLEADGIFGFYRVAWYDAESDGWRPLTHLP